MTAITGAIGMAGRRRFTVFDGAAPAPRWDDLGRYVHVTSRARSGYVEFNFSIGDPQLYIEMILPLAAFDAFCAEHQVQFIDAATAAQIERDERKWQYGDLRDDEP